MLKRVFIFPALLLFIPLLMGFQGRIYDFSLKDVNRKMVSLSDIKGENLTVIDFWATCPQPGTGSETNC